MLNNVTFFNVYDQTGASGNIACGHTLCSSVPRSNRIGIFWLVYLWQVYWYNCDWVQMADWIRGNLHQCQLVHLLVLFLLFTGRVGPASCRFIIYWAKCWLVFGWQAAQCGSSSSAKWQLPSTGAHCLHVSWRLTYAKYSVIRWSPVLSR